MFQAVVEFFPQKRLHQFQVANRIVHEVDLPFEDEKIVKNFRLFDHWSVIFNFDDWLFVVRLDFDIRFATDRVASEIKIFQGFPRNGNTLLGDMLIAEPFTSVVALVLVASDEIKALLEGFVALVTELLFVL